MKKNIFILLIIFTFSISYSIEEFWQYVWKTLFEINMWSWKNFDSFKNNFWWDNLQFTKKMMLQYFCYTMDKKADKIKKLSEKNFDPKKSIFLRYLCNETSLYKEWIFAQNIQLNNFFQSYVKNIIENSKSKNNECHISWYNTIKWSLNNINFACVSKRIFDAVASDITNLMSAKSYWFFNNSEELKTWQKNIFLKKVCLEWKYIDWIKWWKPSLCSHPYTYKYMKKISNNLKMVLNNLKTIELNPIDIKEFIKKLWYSQKSIPMLILLNSQLYNELYFYNLFLSYYKSFLNYWTKQSYVVKVWTNAYNVTQAEIDKQAVEVDTDIFVAQAIIKKSVQIIKDIYWTFPVHIWFLSIIEDINVFRHTLAKIYTPLDQLRYKLKSVQDLDKK